MIVEIPGKVNVFPKTEIVQAVICILGGHLSHGPEQLKKFTIALT